MPTAPQLRYPSSGSIRRSPSARSCSTFRWTAVPGATLYELELQVQAEDGTWSTAENVKVEETHYRPERMEVGRYRWRVRALRDEVGGDWSKVRRLYLY